MLYTIQKHSKQYQTNKGAKVKKRINFIVLTQNCNIQWIIRYYIKLNTVQKFDAMINEPYLLTLMNYRLCMVETETDLLIDALHP